MGDVLLVWIYFSAAGDRLKLLLERKEWVILGVDLL
jgi:hypothetical protein